MRTRLIIATLSGALLAGCTGQPTAQPATPPTQSAHPSPTPAQGAPLQPQVAPDAFLGQGKLAFLSLGRLYVLDGATGRFTAITDRGTATAPVWSADGQWLAFLYAESEGSPQQLRIAMADASTAEMVALPDGVVPWDYAWSPATAVLAMGAQSGLWLKEPGLEPRLLVPGQFGRNSITWTPDGKLITYAATLPAPQPPPGTVVEQIAPTGGKPVRLLTAPERAVHLAGWLPQAKGLLAWAGPMSASLSADGMQLELITPDGKEHPLTTMLAYREWVSPSPDGARVLAVAGSGRMAWIGKSLTLCDVAIPADAKAKAGAKSPCTPLPLPKGKVDLDPAFSPRGDRIAFVRADELPGDVGGTEVIERWVPSRALWTAAPDGTQARDLTGASRGIYQPQWSADGRQLLFVRDNAIWLMAAENAKEPVRIAGPLYGDLNLFGYYGFSPSTPALAWYQP
jgi:dipeptidyl aminopeptidase/acylaminoacyl peptidase